MDVMNTWKWLYQLLGLLEAIESSVELTHITNMN
jgi:hypothetical protein